MPTTVLSASLSGVKAVPVTVEVDIVNRLPCVCIVGLSAGAVKETTERVKSAILSSGFEFPRKRIVVNVAPADLPKAVPTGLDLPIAVAILAASGQLSKAAMSALSRTLLVGELSLGGAVRPVRGSVPLALLAAESGHALILGGLGSLAASYAPDANVFAVRDLREALTALAGEARAILPVPFSPDDRADPVDFSDVRGQSEAVSALEAAICTSGKPGDYILLVGQPGCGKTMMARRLATILPALTLDEAREVAAIHSAVGLLPDDTRPSLPARPFRAPHHSVTAAGLVGSAGRPGEASLAHHGVLFLDEADEFRAATLGVLSSVLREGAASCRTFACSFSLPARPVLVVLAVNNEAGVERVIRSMGQPHATIRVPVPSRETLLTAPKGEASATIRARIEAAKE